jgi:serine/threonine-protein kinase
MTDDELARDLQPGDICGPYRIGRLLDEGGFSVVYAGTNTRTGEPAALKILKPERGRVEEIVERFAREIELLAKIEHENVVQFYETGYARGRLWLAMELLDGRTLRKHLIERGRFPLEEALRVAYEIACGVAQAQALRVIHRDLKPENVILTQARVVKVLDFGIAKFNGQGLQSTGRLRGVLGTPSYMSPEQILGNPVTFASDVYQIGVMIYEMVAGRHPFANRRGEMPTQTQMCEFHVEFPPRPLTELGVPDDVWAVITRALAKDPRERCPTVEAFARALWSALVRLRASLSEQALPQDYQNPAGADGEPLGAAARRAYQPALTPALDPPPTLPSGSVRLRTDLRATATATRAPRSGSEARTITIEEAAPVGPMGTVRLAPRPRSAREALAGGGERTTLPTPESRPIDRAPAWLAPGRSSPPSSLSPIVTVPRLLIQSARPVQAARAAQAARAVEPGDATAATDAREAPPRWLVGMMLCSATLCVLIVGYYLLGRARAVASVPATTTPSVATAIVAPSASAAPPVTAAPVATSAAPAVSAAPTATTSALVAAPRVRRPAPAASAPKPNPLFQLPFEKPKDVF